MKLSIHPIVLKVSILLLLMIGSTYVFRLTFWVELVLANVSFLLLLLGIEDLRAFRRDPRDLGRLLSPIAGVVLLVLAIVGSVRSAHAIAAKEYDFVPLLAALDDFKQRYGDCPDRLRLLDKLEPNDEVLYDAVNFSVRKRPDGTKYFYRCDEGGFQLTFEHHMFIKHEFDSQLGYWVDWK